MSGLFASGRIVDLLLAFVVLEAVALAVYRFRTGSGPAPMQIAGSLLAGACLMLALRGALTGGPWSSIAPWLAASLAAHLVDLRQRWSAR